MSFDPKHPNRKDWRKPYFGSARFDRSCRNGGSCGYCQGNRTVYQRRLRAQLLASINELRASKKDET